jgi:hypothetical protein
MEQFKRAKVIMLPTKKETLIKGSLCIQDENNEK